MDWARAAKQLDDYRAFDPEGQRAIEDRLASEDPDLSTFLRTQSAREEDTGFMATRAAPDVVTDTARFGEGDMIGPWRIEQLLGAGGMGAVYRAFRDDETYRQSAAIKVVARKDGDLARRFASERQRLALLEHPNVARIIDGGEDADGYPYMAVEYVEGETIDAYCQRVGASRGKRLRLLRQLCAALAHAHARLVLHRDVKPANVLVNEAGEVRLIDFGIAQSLASESEGRPGPLTFAIAAPEQLNGGQVTVATDIFQTGMTAHFLLTGEWPRRLSDGGVAIGDRARQDADLAAILNRALASDPADRYDSIDALGEDFAALREGAPVAAREGGALYRLGKTVKRYRFATAASVLAICALVGGLGLSLWQAQQALNARNLAEAEVASRDMMKEGLYFLLAEGDGLPGEQSRFAEAAGRITNLFEDDPGQYASVLQALGELQLYMADYTGASETYDRLLARSDRIDPATLAIAQHHLAQAKFHVGEYDRARELLAQAQRFYRSDGGRWALRMFESRMTEAQLLRETDPDRALQLLRANLARYEESYGSGSHRSGVMLNNIGAAEFARGEIGAAADAFGRADALWRANGLSAGFDSFNTLNNLASAQHLLGQSEDAASTFARAVELREALFGPSGATAALLNNYGKVLASLGRYDEALPHLDRAVAMSAQYVGEGSILHVAALNGQSEALTGAGDPRGMVVAEAARRWIEQSELPAPLVAGNHIALAKAQHAFGDVSTAKGHVGRADEIAKQIGPTGERMAGQIAALRAEIGD